MKTTTFQNLWDVTSRSKKESHSDPQQPRKTSDKQSNLTSKGIRKRINKAQSQQKEGNMKIKE